MSIRQKFILLAGIVGIILTAVSIIGYSTASSNLNESVESELLATVEIQGKSFDGWIREKSAPAVNAANQMSKFIGADKNFIQNIMKLAESDKNIMAITNCDETGMVLSNTADYTGKLEIRTRDWYKNVKSAGKLIFTDVYQDATNGKLVVSAAMPYFDSNGKFYGAICDDISVDTLNEEIKQINYRGEGKGMIIDRKGKIIASADTSENMQDISSSREFQQMINQRNGFFLTDDENVFAYTTIESTGWIVAISVPQKKVFAAVNNLRMTYIFLTIATILGIFITVFFSLTFSNKIIKNIVNIKEHTEKLAQGNIKISDLQSDSKDEFGELAQTFNSMIRDVRALIKKVVETSEKVAKSSEELTASAQQSAETSNYILETVVKVSKDMENQIESIEMAKQDINSVYTDVTSVSEKSKQVTENTNLTAETAQMGEKLMQDAMAKMTKIEKSVSDSAETVEKLGENSKQIGMIVEAIASIADQTNLLALNAAIEAARAGEAGRGFSIVSEEVRKLSISSQESVEKIRDSISKIQSDTQKAVLSMKNGMEEVKNGSSAIREVGTQFEQIINMVNVNKQQIDDISHSVQNVSVGTSRMVEIIDQINYISRSTAEHTQAISTSTENQNASTEEIAKSSRSLSDIAIELQIETNKFKV